MPAVSRKAYAKLNLMLSVGAPEPPGAAKPGWHPIASWMACVDLCDDVSITRLNDGEPSSHEIRWADNAPRPTTIDWPIDKDLAVRAHKALEAHTARSLPVKLVVNKRIPVGGGMGGGAADAAATLLAINEVFSLDLGEDQLRSVAATLGSDAAFFTDSASPPRPAIVTGFGETLERVRRINGEIALIIPPFSCPTPPVYQAYDQVLAERRDEERLERSVRGLTGREKQTGPRLEMLRSRLERMLESRRISGDHLFNDLALAAYRVEPRLGALVTALSKGTRQTAHVTGSGSCIFIAAEPGKADRLMDRVRKALATAEPNAVSLLTRLL